MHLSQKLSGLEREPREEMTNLGEGIINVVVHNNHKKNGNGYTKVTHQTSDLVNLEIFLTLMFV